MCHIFSGHKRDFHEIVEWMEVILTITEAVKVTTS